jgi:hypothetical protein
MMKKKKKKKQTSKYKMSTMKDILEMIQASRPKPPPVLFEGGLQGNTDQYFSPTDLHNLNNVPKPPPKVYREEGATVELDNRHFITAQPQVPRDAELENLTEYFNKQRVLASAQAFRPPADEVLSKMAEMEASRVVREEIDRRVGIRRAVLEATGFTPAQIEEELARDALAGINPRVVDVRDRQVQEAVNLYYRVNNIPQPVTTPAGPREVVNATMGSDVGGVPDTTDLDGGADVEEDFGDAEERAVGVELGADEAPAVGYANRGANAGGVASLLNEVQNQISRAGSADNFVAGMTASQLADLVHRLYIHIDGLTARGGLLYKRNTLITNKFAGPEKLANARTRIAVELNRMIEANADVALGPAVGGGGLGHDAQDW